jgi:hypothetical protein
VTNLVGPAVAPGAVGFRLILVKPVLFGNNADQFGIKYQVIPPEMFVGFGTNLISGTNGIVITNFFPILKICCSRTLTRAICSELVGWSALVKTISILR